MMFSLEIFYMIVNINEEQKETNSRLNMGFPIKEEKPGFNIWNEKNGS